MAPFPGRERDRVSRTSAWHRPLPVPVAFYHLLGAPIFIKNCAVGHPGTVLLQ
jgi:hypothetical protein